MILTNEEDETMNGILNDLETVYRGTDFITGDTLNEHQKRLILHCALSRLDALWQAEGNIHDAD